MKKIIRIIILILFSLILVLITYKACRLMAEKIFFDKFFYQKSSEYGYWVGAVNGSIFGSRATDIVPLEKNQKSNEITDNKTFKIAIIGDSYVWGVGVKNKERFVELLDKKLNKIRLTRVYSLAKGGDNIFDDYSKYKKSIDLLGKMDLYIFALVNNDLLYNPDNRYGTNTTMVDNLKIGCTGQAFSDLPFNGGTTDFDLYSLDISKAMDPTSQNYCVFKKLVPLFPKENTFFVNLDSILYGNCQMQNKFLELMSQSFFPIITPKTNIKSSKLNVSEKEGHPSVITHQIYANAIFDEITKNPRWNFEK